MKAKELKELLKKKTASEILTDYMTGKIFLTQYQLQKVIDLKEPYEKNHGGCCFRGKKWKNMLYIKVKNV